jgi:hypothetical protein
MFALLLRSTKGEDEPQDLDTSKIKEWRSIVTLIVFVLTSKLILRFILYVLG